MSRNAFQKLADPFFLDVAPDEAIDHPAWCEALAAARSARDAGVRGIVLVGDDGVGRSLLASVLRAEGLAATPANPLDTDAGAADPTRAVVTIRRATPEEIGVFLGVRLSAAGLSANLIEAGARRLIADRAGGSVAEASRIAGLALAEAGRAKARRVRPRHVRRHLPNVPTGRRRSRQILAAGAIIAACGLIVPLRAGWLGTSRPEAHRDRTTLVATAKPADLGMPVAPAERQEAVAPRAVATPPDVAYDPGPVAPAASAPARPLPPVPASVVPAPMSAPPADTPPPVTVALRFDQADPGARERASRLARALSALGVADVEPVGVRHALPEAVGYRFGEDRGTALAVGRAMQALDDRTASIQRDRDPPDHTGPGVIDVSLGG